MELSQDFYVALTILNKYRNDYRWKSFFWRINHIITIVNDIDLAFYEDDTADELTKKAINHSKWLQDNLGQFAALTDLDHPMEYDSIYTCSSEIKDALGA